jgi:tRNA dimethylallyltransferase
VDDGLLVVVGPTASGKTELAVRLAERLGGEVVGADSVQVYRAFDIGSGKPTRAQLRRAAHHLVGIVDPLEPMDAATWAKLADAAIADIRARGKRAIICGGTFLWIKALLFGLAPAPPADPTVRQRHHEEAVRCGHQALHRRLSGVDPTSAERLDPNDLVRVSRALEVIELSGVPLSQWQQQHGFRDPRYTYRLVGIARRRPELDRRISQRIIAMLEAGWVQEVSQLLAQGYSSARAMESVGYRQIAEALAARTPAPGRDELEERIYRATRVFARRQQTWLRDQPVRWLSPEQAESVQCQDWW